MTFLPIVIEGLPLFLRKASYTIDMLKKVPACLIAFLLFTSFLFAQVSDEAEVVSSGVPDTFEQALSATAKTQHIQWQDVKRAHGYALELQQKEDGTWLDIDTYETDVPEYDFVLEPGFYRFRISAMNALGKKGTPTAWAEFELVEDGQPVLQRQSLPDSDRYGVPAIIRSCEDGKGTELITIRGINCYSDDTSFSLVPVGNQAGKPFTTVEKQTAVPLPIAGKNARSHTVSLSVDWSRLVSGYYNLRVEKKTGERDEFEVLVLTNRLPELFIERSYYNELFAASSIDVKEADGVMAFDAESLQSDTYFYLDSDSYDELNNPYPFASSFNREQVAVDKLKYDGGKVTLKVDPSLVKPGWYTVWAETPEIGASGYGILVEADYTYSTLPEITDVMAKVKQDTQTFALTLRSDVDFFTEENIEKMKVFCISEKNMYGENNRQQMRMTSSGRNGKSAVFEVAAGSLVPGQYAIMIETAEASRFVFITITSQYKASLVTLSDDEIRNQFLKVTGKEMLAARTAETADQKYPEDLPAFNEDDFRYWDPTYSFSFPAVVGYDSGTLRMAVSNNIPNLKYSSSFRIKDNETLRMLREAEGFSFESMVTGRNNGKTKWRLLIETDDDEISIPLNSKLKTLSQTVVKWEDYGIDPSTISDIRYVVDAKDPHEAGWTNSLEIYNAKTYSSLDPIKTLSFKKPLLFTKVGAFAAINTSDQPAFVSQDVFNTEHLYGIDDRVSDSSIPSYMYLSLFDTGWYSFNAVFAPVGMGSRPMFGVENVLAIPNDWFEPYLSIGYLYNGNEMWREESFGVVLFKYLNIRSTLLMKHTTLGELGFITGSQTATNTEIDWDSNWLQIGLELPLRKQKVEYRDQSLLEAKDPVWLTELHLGFTERRGKSVALPDLFRLDDFFAGVRLVGFKYFAIDTAVAVRNVPVNNLKKYGSLDFGADMKFMLPLFKGNFTPFIGIGCGYNAGHFESNSYPYLSSESGVRLGKYVSFSVARTLAENDLDDFLDLAAAAPTLVPATYVLSSSCCFKLTITLPLRTKK